MKTRQKDATSKKADTLWHQNKMEQFQMNHSEVIKPLNDNICAQK